MTMEVWGMMITGTATLIAGLVLVYTRFKAASGADRILVLGPVFEAVALAAFAAEHFLAARTLMPIVPHWLPEHLFWTYFFGAALLAAALSFILRRCVLWSSSLLALFFLLVVTTISLPNISGHMHERLHWTLTVRELCFACGALVLAGSVWPGSSRLRAAVIRISRSIVAVILIFYSTQHFLFPRFAPGVPLEKMTPAWVPDPVLFAYFIGATLLLGGIGLLIPKTVRIASASAGAVQVLLTLFFYVPIFVTEMHSSLAVEGLNYIGDTLLFASTILLAGLATREQDISVS